MKLSWQKNRLELKKSFKISRGTYLFREVLIISLQDENIIGIGETIQHDYYEAHIEEFISELTRHKEEIENFNYEHPSEFYEFLRGLDLHSFLISGLDIAAYDLYGKQKGTSLRSILNIEESNKFPETSYTISIDTKEKMWEDMQINNWPSYKIKLGTEEDIEIIKYLRSKTNAPFRIDPNCAWTADQCIDFGKAFKDQGIEFLEQPLKVGDIEGMKRVMEHCPIPVISDESITTLKEYHEKKDLFHGINLKLTKSGGITPCYRILQEARKDQKLIMFGCMTESTISISAAASMLPWVHFADLDGTLLLKNDLASGLTVKDAKLYTSGKPGLGIELLN